MSLRTGWRLIAQRASTTPAGQPFAVGLLCILMEIAWHRSVIASAPGALEQTLAWLE